MYESGYGGDKADIYGGGYNAREEELRRKREQMQQPMQQQAPYQQPDAKPQQPPQQSMQPAQPSQQAQQAQALQQQQKTFAELQQQGQARPAPPPAQPAQMTPMQGGGSSFVAPGDPMQARAAQQATSMGLDPVAAMANPQQYEQYVAQMQQREAAMPGSTMMAASSGGAPMGGAMTGMQNEQGFDYAELMSGPRMAASSAPGGNAFTGDLGAFYGQQLNAVGANAPTLPTAYDPSTGALATRAQQLGSMTLPNAPVYTPNAALMQQAQQLTQTGQIGTGGMAPAGMSAGGLDPMAAMSASAPAAAAPASAPASAPAGAPMASAPGARQGSHEALLQEAYNTPSGFDNAAVQQLYNRMGQDIDDQYAQQQTALREEMAARGLSDSSIMGGRLADLNVGQRQARTELANQLGIQRAQDYANQRNAVLGLGLNQQGQNLQAELGRGNLGLAGQRLGLEAQGQQFGQAMQGLQFQNLLGQQGFQNQMTAADFGLRRAGQEFGQGLQGAQFQNSLGQQGFQNRMSLADFQRGLGNDAFSQRMGLTDRLANYGQQAFDNDLRRNEFNRLTQNDQDNLMLRYFFGMGG